MTAAQIVQLRPVRTTPKGRERPPEYLYRVNYPPLLSGQRCTLTLTGNPADALTYDDDQGLAAILALVASLGYDDAVPVELSEIVG